MRSSRPLKGIIPAKEACEQGLASTHRISDSLAPVDSFGAQRSNRVSPTHYRSESPGKQQNSLIRAGRFPGGVTSKRKASLRVVD